MADIFLSYGHADRARAEVIATALTARFSVWWDKDLDAAVVNTDWALKSGLNPETDRIAQEAVKDNPYNNFIAVRTDRKDEPWVKDLVASYQNDSVKAAFDTVYKGTGISAW